MEFVEILPVHWESVKRIYEEGIATGNATFETVAPSWNKWDTAHMKSCRILAIESNIIPGWAALSPVSARLVYAGVAEVSVYVAAAARGRGIGKLLLKELITASEKAGFWMLQSGIFPENHISIKLHEDCGFRIVGKRQHIGQMNGTWRDTMLLERRSKVVGI